MLTYDHAEAWRLWKTGQFASRVELADHLGTSRQTLTQSLKRYGFKTPPRKLATDIVGPNCICCGREIERRAGEACSDWRRRRRCTDCRKAKAKTPHVGEPFERHYNDSGALLAELQASEHPPGEGELSRQTLAMFLAVRQCDRPVLAIWFGNAWG